MAIRISILIVLAGLISACAEAAAPRPPKGRCEMNTDCRDGERCIDTWCEDIYKPRREIKNY